MSKTKKKRRNNLSIFNLRNIQHQNLEPENNEINQLSELRDIISVSAPDSLLDTSFFLPNNESNLLNETSNNQNISIVNNNSDITSNFQVSEETYNLSDSENAA